MEEKKKVGRPKKTLADLPKDWKEKLFELADGGASMAEWQLMLKLGYHGWMTLIADSDEFRDAVDEAKTRAKIWWEKVGRGLVTGNNGNGNVWNFNMKNRYGWKDRVEMSGDQDAPLQINHKGLIGIHMTDQEASQAYIDMITGAASPVVQKKEE